MIRCLFAVVSSLFITALLSNSAFAAGDDNSHHWYEPAQADLAYITTPHGEVVIAFTDAIAPAHVSRFKQLVQRRFYDNRYFYRVLEGFVAQAGANHALQDPELTEPLEAEFFAQSVEHFYEVERPGAFAPVTGFIQGIPAATTVKRESYWLTHCPGAVAMARDNKKDSATSDFYVVTGQAPRHLDRNMSVFGRVVAGMEALQALPRGTVENAGVISNLTDQSQILSIRLGSDLPTPQQRQFKIQLPSHPDYQKKIELARNLDNPFFHDKLLAPRSVDICYYLTAVEEN